MNADDIINKWHTSAPDPITMEFINHILNMNTSMINQVSLMIAMNQKILECYLIKEKETEEEFFIPSIDQDE